VSKTGKQGKQQKEGETKEAAAPEPKVEPRLLAKYRQEVAPGLRDRFQLGNPMTIPRLKKIVINMGVGRAVENKARIDAAVRDLTTISGQKPVATKARSSVSGFKLREGAPVGVAVTLRGARMWEFLDRLISIAVPRIRDFRGFSTKLDGRGNYSMGLSEQSVFPEINLDKVEFVQGMHITLVTSAGTDEKGLALLQLLGVPFRK
jgi:large subunit ribosomal protein L5